MKEKQIQSMKSELEFKNLEIVNLRQSKKIVDISKYNISTTWNSSKVKPKQLAKPKETIVETIKETSNLGRSKLHVALDPVYPLKRLASQTVFNVPKIEKHVIENKLTHSSRNAIPYLKNQTISTSVVVENTRVNMENIHPAMLDLAECTSEALNLRENITKVNKIVCASLQLLTDLQELLEQIKTNLGTEDILEADSMYLKKNYMETTCQNFGRDEMGMKSGLVVNFLAELLPYCDYFKSYLFGGNLDLLGQGSVAEYSPYLSTKRFHTGQHFLSKLVDIAQLIGELRKADVMSLFLRSSIKVFTNICKLKKYECVSDWVCRFTKQLIFLRPSSDIVLEMTYFFKEASQSTSFVEFLLNKSKSCSSIKKGVVYFNNDACRFYIFVLMFDRCMYNLKTAPLDVSVNLLCFMYNTYKTSFFIHHQDIKECECLPQLYKLGIEIVFRALEQYKGLKRDKEETREWNDFFKNKITVKLLSLMTFLN
ncbi:hypothetical protein JTB14_014039 [Gonioctena quinquepunctata]|nr:hypothetical protein JTB14_014039 [Gonioctena quinquepunctata]